MKGEEDEEEEEEKKEGRNWRRVKERIGEQLGQQQCISTFSTSKDRKGLNKQMHTFLKQSLESSSLFSELYT